MAYITTNMPTAERRTLSQKFGQYLKARAAFRKEQYDYRRLLALSNRDLKDMGISRDDVREQMMRKVSWNGAA